jgi:hypothetical protein
VCVELSYDVPNLIGGPHVRIVVCSRENVVKQRSRWISGSFAVLALTMASCSDSGVKTLSEDDFIDQLDDVCRTATRDIDRLDASDENYVGEIVEIMETGYDELGELKPPNALEDDFNDFSDNLDDQITQAQRLERAIDDGDEDAAQQASDRLDDLSADADDLADSIGADRCIGIAGSGGSETTDPPTDDTATDDTATDDTATPATPLPLDPTFPDDTDPPQTDPTVTDPTVPDDSSVTSAPVDGAAIDATEQFFEPDGYTWGTLDDLAGTAVPDDPALTGILEGYYAGVLESDAGGNGFLVYIIDITDGHAWTPDELDAYLSFEGVADGDDITTPTLQLPGKFKANAFEGLDAAVFYIDGFGVSVLAPTGDDVVTLLETFVLAQSQMEG